MEINFAMFNFLIFFVCNQSFTINSGVCLLNIHLCLCVDFGICMSNSVLGEVVRMAFFFT